MAPAAGMRRVPAPGTVLANQLMPGQQAARPGAHKGGEPMRRCITRILAAASMAGAATAVLGVAAGAAGAAARPAAAFQGASLPVVATSSYGGYQASGRDFRYIHAAIMVPNAPQDSQFPQIYVQLSNGSLATGDTYTRAGIETCLVAEAVDSGFSCPAGVEWAGFIEAFSNTITGLNFTHFVPLDVGTGDGVGVSIYFDQPGNELHYVLTPPTVQSCSTGPQNQCYYEAAAGGPVFDHAAGLADYTNSTGSPIPLDPAAQQFRLTQLWQGALTTYNGTRGSWAGPWTLSVVEATSNGLPFPEGTTELSPGFLWTDGATVNGAARGNDVFGIWRRA
jgi:hypothetical protein